MLPKYGIILIYSFLLQLVFGNVGLSELQVNDDYIADAFGSLTLLNIKNNNNKQTNKQAKLQKQTKTTATEYRS